jgi:hypothetical protein
MPSSLVKSYSSNFAYLILSYYTLKGLFIWSRPGGTGCLPRDPAYIIHIFLNNLPIVRVVCEKGYKGRFTLHNFCLKLSHTTCLQLELDCVNQAHHSHVLRFSLMIELCHVSAWFTQNLSCKQVACNSFRQSCVV